MGFVDWDAHKRVEGRKRPYFGRYLRTTCCLHQWSCADVSDPKSGQPFARGGLSALFPNICIVIADGGHQRRRLTRGGVIKTSRLRRCKSLNADSASSRSRA